jgi:hypothetical protein
MQIKIIQIYWIPAHIGITHDERADIAAKESAYYTGTDSQLLLLGLTLKAHWKQKILKNFHVGCLASGTSKANTSSMTASLAHPINPGSNGNSLVNFGLTCITC